MSDVIKQHDKVVDSHEPSLTAYIGVFIALMGLLVVTVYVAFVHLGAFNLPVAMLIASVKACLVIWYFMHLRSSPRLVLVFVIAAVIMLAIGAILLFADYATRN